MSDKSINPTPVQFVDGPLAGAWYQPRPSEGIRFTVVAAIAKVGFPLDTRLADYELTDDENRTARFVGWHDEIIDAMTDGPMQRALANASDDDILKLFDDINEAEREREK